MLEPLRMGNVTMLAVAALLSVATAACADPLPVERGYYDRSNTPCQAVYRYCKQSDLPEPWRTNNLSSYGLK